MRRADGSAPATFVATIHRVIEIEVVASGLRHGVTTASIEHACHHPLKISTAFETDSEKVLVLGPDLAGNIIEVIGVFENENCYVVFHAMRARPKYLALLDQPKEYE